MKHLPALLLVLACSAQAQPGPALTPQRGAAVPLGTALVDEQGRAVTLAQYAGGRAILLAPVYFRCPNLCDTLLAQLLQTLALAPGAARGVELVALSIDPREGPRDAAARKAAFHLDAAMAAHVHLLTGDATAVTAAIGYRAVPLADGQYAHPGVSVLLAPSGRVAQYFGGVGPAPAVFAQGVASIGDPAAPSLLEQVVLLCRHLNPLNGRHSGAALAAVRLTCLAVLAALGLWCWRRRRA